MKTKTKIESNQKKKKGKILPMSATPTRSRSRKSRSTKEYIREEDEFKESSENINTLPSTSRNLKSGHLDLNQFSGFHAPEDDLDYQRHYESTSFHQLESPVKGLKVPTFLPPLDEPIQRSQNNQLTVPVDPRLNMVGGQLYPRLLLDPLTIDTRGEGQHYYEEKIVNPEFRYSPTHSLRVDDKFSPTAESFTSSSSTSSNTSLKSTYIELDDKNFPGLKNNSVEYPNQQNFRHRPQHPRRTDTHNGKGVFHKDATDSRTDKLNQLTNKKSDDPPTVLNILFNTFFGSSSFVSKFIDPRQDNFLWSPLIFLEILFRSITQVALASNVFSGFLIFLVMMIVSPFETTLGILAVFSGTCTSIFILQIPIESVRGGGITFNSLLIGTTIGAFSTIHYNMQYFFICINTFLAGSLVIFMWYCLEGLFVRLRIKGLNLSFNLLAVLYLKGIVESSSDLKATKNMTDDQHFFPNHTITLDWVRVFEGILLSPSQLYGTTTLWSCIIVYLAWLIYSPILFMQALLGSCIGNLVGVLLFEGHNEHQSTLIYNGSWAYCPLLTSVAIGGIFFVFNLKCWIMSIKGASLTALVFSAMTRVKLPIFGIPFMLITWLVLCASNNKLVNQKNNPHWMLILNEEVVTPEIDLVKFLTEINKDKPKKPKKEKKSKGPAEPAPLELHL